MHLVTSACVRLRIEEGQHLSVRSTATMRNTTNRPDLEGFSTSCITVTIYLMAAMVCIPLVVIGAYGMTIFVAVTVLLIWSGLLIIKWNKKNRAERMPTHNWSHPRDRPPMNTISASVPPAPPAPRMRRTGETTPPVTTPGHPTSQYPLSVSSRLSHSYYTHHAGFSSLTIASHTENTRSYITSSSTWHPPTSYAPSELFPSSLPGYTATSFAANVLQPPAYPAVAEDNTGLPPTHHTTPATDEGPATVFEPSNDGLPSYEAAMSTRKPPAYEAPSTPHDDGPTTND